MKETKSENLHQQQTTKNNADHLESNFSLSPPALVFSGSTNPAQLQEEEEEMLQAKMKPAQLQEEEEEMLQAKMKPAQLQEEEEEMLQAKMKPAQLQEEEEEMQAKMNPTQLQEEEEEMQAKMNPTQLQEEEEEMQAKMDQSAQVAQSGPETHSSTKMPENVQAKMESSLGADFSNVNIHKDSSKASDVGALAYAQGSDVHFAPGQFKPESHAGQELLGHELTHIVQQREGRVSTNIQKKGMNINNDPGLENEADQLGKKAANHKEK